jgi:hypothetical protein
MIKHYLELIVSCEQRIVSTYNASCITHVSRLTTHDLSLMIPFSMKNTFHICALVSVCTKIITLCLY